MLRFLSKKLPADFNSFTISPDVRATAGGDGIAFLDVRKGALFRANRVGAAIWKGLAARRSLEQISEEVSRDFGVSQREAFEDASRFAAQLQAAGILGSAGRNPK
jgi:hypothetical protein